MKISLKSLVFVFSVLLGTSVFAEVKLPAIFGNNMVFQRNIAIKIWGWADEKVTISFNNKTYSTLPDINHKWTVYMDALPAGGPYTLTVSGKNTITFTNILIGEVWVCSGQSNMEWKFSWWPKGNYSSEVAASENPNIRYIDVNNEYDLYPREDVKIQKGWSQANPENTFQFSCVAYFFARELYEKYKVPIGLISSEWGGTVAEAWTSYEGLHDFPNYVKRLDELRLQEKIVTKQPPITPEEWNKALAEKDKHSMSWIAPDAKTNQWKTMNLPGTWETQGLENLDGIVVFKKEITISKADAGKEITLYLAAIDDIDTTYFNGVKIGYTNGYATARKYTIAGNLVKAGKNVIAVKILDTGGGGGIWGDENMLKMVTTENTIPLAGKWQYNVSVSNNELPPNPNGGSTYPNQPAVLYNAMIAPIVSYGIKGVIWYQGESNTGKAYEYRTLFPAMITDWRNRWGLGDFPFLFVQLANYMKTTEQPVESEWAELREAQNKALSLPNTGEAVIIDIGGANDIHPKNKLDVGKRLALSAMKVAYNDQKVVYSGPAYKSMTVEKNKIRLLFENTGSGLDAKGGELVYFAIAGADKKFVWATAKIENNSIIVWNDQVKNPVAVRYAWANNPEGCNLYNKEGLPASPFRTDNWDGITKTK